MKRILVLVALIAAMPLAAQVADGDVHWAKRGEGSQAGHAKSPEVDAAIGAYQKAVAANANDLDAQWKLLRAIRFKGAYVASSNDDKKVVYSEAKKAGDNALAVVDRQLRAKGITSVTKATEKQVADAARQIAGAGQIFFWDSVNWGEWALVYGKLAAVKEGAADRIKRESTIAMLVDPKMEAGGPARVLGRLHDQTPHVPFITGWASNKEAVKYLNESLKIDPANKITKVFLAEAMVDNDSDTKPAAVQMLRDVVNAPNAADFEVEWAAATTDARALLRKWGT
jgi:tetratricopeptide (TPR) repeat protein